MIMAPDREDIIVEASAKTVGIDSLPPISCRKIWVHIPSWNIFLVWSIEIADRYNSRVKDSAL